MCFVLVFGWLVSQFCDSNGDGGDDDDDDDD